MDGKFITIERGTALDKKGNRKEENKRVREWEAGLHYGQRPSFTVGQPGLECLVPIYLLLGFFDAAYVKRTKWGCRRVNIASLKCYP